MPTRNPISPLPLAILGLAALFAVLAAAPLVWTKVCIIRWRSGSDRGLPIGGVAVGSAGVALVVVTGAALRSVIGLSALQETSTTGTMVK